MQFSGLPWQKQHSTTKNHNYNDDDNDNNNKILFIRKLDLKFTEETSETLRLEHSFVWCWKLLKIDQK
jgi:hypothetical protein